jgi:hypothetical protein
MFLGLFLKPALIVAGLVGVLVLFSWAGKFLSSKGWAGGRAPEQFLQGLDDTNKTVRWQTASDLAQVLLRDDRLASDPTFNLALADRLDRARSDSAAAEQALAARLTTLDTPALTSEREKLETERQYVLYLSACLANFMLPAGAPVLEDMAVQDKGLEPRALAQRRRLVLWALANLGENLKRFDHLPADRQDAALAGLDTAADGAQGRWAHQSADYLRRRREGHADALGMDRVIATCAAADDPAVREYAALASNFWSGTAAEDARIEQALVRLAHDDGRGESELTGLLEENPQESRTVVRSPGFRVRANATVALARRGSARVDLGILQEMLDPDLLRKRFVVRQRKSGEEQPDETLVAGTLVNALKATTELHHKRPEMNLARLRPGIDRLAEDANAAVQAEARQSREALDKPS